ncbi:unnamed protein product [Didymodactylos carnosus]|uniref:Uncharacterized protein n=1 Tax=Didymodactylos carnosus TaxID=1234261 RepID=A0A814ZBR0_9BILA|nr:unnamed protein product [Didymodactylos carnosus]CAF1241461.1 unnamed protein product [Didymodactylos carnosus]CAF3728283.1 unnamed protein product [Didymodactylos carnosus]CAF4004766.1 unnamed protein product [Didymodactylos carnosus]
MNSQPCILTNQDQFFFPRKIPIVTSSLTSYDYDDDKSQKSISTLPRVQIVGTPYTDIDDHISEQIPSTIATVLPHIAKQERHNTVCLEDDSNEDEKPQQQPISLPSLRQSPSKRSQVDPDIFRKAYEKALSVARSKMLQTNHYSLDASRITNRVLYSYFSHTPYCMFKPTTCTHKHQRQDKASLLSKKVKPNQIRKNIFDDVIVENYIRW